MKSRRVPVLVTIAMIVLMVGLGFVPECLQAARGKDKGRGWLGVSVRREVGAKHAKEFRLRPGKGVLIAGKVKGGCETTGNSPNETL